MKSIIPSYISKTIIGAAFAATLFAASSASADRGSTFLAGSPPPPDPGSTFVAAPQRPVEEYVLGNLRVDDGNRGLTLKTAAPDSGIVGRGATNLVGTSSPQAGHNAADDFKAGPGCSIQCITSGVAYARGPNAKLVVKTDTPARIWIHVSGPNDYYRVMSSGTDEVMEFGAYFDDLNDGQTYEAWAIAKDEDGFESEGNGSFTTLWRNVEISYTHANIIERAFNSDADFKVGVWLDGEWDDDLFSYNLPADDDYLGLGIYSFDLEWVDRYLDFAIQLWEAPDYCNNLGSADQPYWGEGSCSFLSYAELLEGENDLDARPGDATSWTEWTLHRTMELPAGLWPSYADELHFEVPVTLHVYYTP